MKKLGVDDWGDPVENGKLELGPHYVRYLCAGHPASIITSNGPCGVNAAAYAMLCDVSYDPPMFMFGTRKKKDKMWQHTAYNVVETGCFAVNIPGIHLIDALHGTGGEFDVHVNEIEELGLTQLKPFKLADMDEYPPLIGECPIHIECKLRETFKPGDHTLYVGEVVSCSIDKRLVSTDKPSMKEIADVLTRKVKPLVFLGSTEESGGALRLYTVYANEVIEKAGGGTVPKFNNRK